MSGGQRWGKKYTSALAACWDGMVQLLSLGTPLWPPLTALHISYSSRSPTPTPGWRGIGEKGGNEIKVILGSYSLPPAKAARYVLHARSRARPTAGVNGLLSGCAFCRVKTSIANLGPPLASVLASF